MSSFNQTLCAKCGGQCCKRGSPGACTPKDWGAPDETQMRERLIEAIRDGRWVLTIAPDLPRIRYIGPLPTAEGCTFLGMFGCRLSNTERPTACRDLIPARNFPTGCHYPDPVMAKGIDQSHLFYARQWIPYQHVIDLVEERLQA